MREKLERFAALVERDQAARCAREYPSLEPPKVVVTHGKRWIRVDVCKCGGRSGKYVVDTDGSIYGIKGYGVPHPGHRYGTLDTIDEWDWSGYVAVRRFACLERMGKAVTP